MAETATIDAALRDRILADPEVVLEDRDLMHALIAANERARGANIVDLRGVAMERLEARLDRLEDTHRSVIAAAYDNLAGTNQIHRAVLKLLEPTDFAGFLDNLGREVAPILRVDRLHLVLESGQAEASEGDAEAARERLGAVLRLVPPGFIEAHLRPEGRAGTRAVVLRQVQPDSDAIYDDAAGWIRSEALMRLDLGAGRLPGMLVFGAEDPHHFRPSQGTDLLAFFAGIFERAMRRWLA